MRAPHLAVGDGALGFWKALREVFPETREQRCWVHKTANVLDARSKSAQPAAKNAIADICNAEDKDQAKAAVKAFGKQYAAKFPKAVAKIVDDEDVLLAFYDYPAEHWIHQRTPPCCARARRRTVRRGRPRRKAGRHRGLNIPTRDPTTTPAAATGPQTPPDPGRFRCRNTRPTET
ncbi:hypothetical protein GCM10009839_87720 [Catenulispora yoronensis]|uniref:Mutator family transposase n=1 Tax=Catenulispora yoronensis TaxID=450799 RepID=A0ABN2VIF9_9ACTN